MVTCMPQFPPPPPADTLALLCAAAAARPPHLAQVIREAVIVVNHHDGALPGSADGGPPRHRRAREAMLGTDVSCGGAQRDRSGHRWLEGVTARHVPCCSPLRLCIDCILATVRYWGDTWGTWHRRKNLCSGDESPATHAWCWWWLFRGQHHAIDALVSGNARALQPEPLQTDCSVTGAAS